MTSLSNGLGNYWPKNVNRSLVVQHAASITMLAVIGLISYGIFYAPILYNDDWSYMVGRWYSGTMKLFDLAELRPFQKAPFAILYGIFGLNIHAFYSVFWFLNILAAVQLYFLMREFIPKSGPLAFGIAAIFLVYPADFTHMWVSQLHNRLAVVLTFMYAHLLITYAHNGRRFALWISLLSLIVSFTLYESQFGIVMLWCLLLILVNKNRWRTRLSLLLPLVIGALFVLWRTVGYSMLEIKDNYQYSNRVQLTPIVIITRFVIGFRAMIWAWLEPLMQAFGLNGGQAMIVILLAITIAGLLTLIISRTTHKLPNDYLTEKEYLDQIRSFILMMVIGSLFIAAGYVPIITVFEPTTFFQTGSRVNGFALPGAAVTTVGFLALVILLLKRKWKQQEINFVGMTMLIPLVFLGTMVQAQIQYDDRVVWEKQKQIWHQLFELAPDLKGETGVYFVLSDTRNQVPSLNVTEQRLPVNASWEVGAALNILYGRHDLKGDVFVRELLHMADDFLLDQLLLREGIKNLVTDEITPYENALFVTYDNNLGQLAIIEDLEAEDLVSFPVPGYRPYERIINTPTSHQELRWLVGAATNSP